MRATGKSSIGRASRAVLVAAAAAILATVLVGAPNVSARYQVARATPDSPVADAVLVLLNAERTKRGLAPLRRNAMLDEAAAWQSRDMVLHRYFNHRRPGGPGLVERIRRTGYLRGASGWTVGENIAWAEAQLASPAHLVADWMASRGHREAHRPPVIDDHDRLRRSLDAIAVARQPRRMCSRTTFPLGYERICTRSQR